MESEVPYEVFQLAIGGSKEDRNAVYDKLVGDLLENEDFEEYLGKEEGSEITLEEMQVIRDIEDILGDSQSFYETADKILHRAQDVNTEIYNGILQYAIHNS